MPLHDVGYRPWSGRLRPAGGAAAVIAATGILLAWKSRWLRRTVLFAWSPALVFAISFFAFEQAVEEGRVARLQIAPPSGGAIDGVGMLGAVLADTLGGGRHGGPTGSVEEIRRLVWSRLLLAFMRAPQAVLLAVVIGLVAPPLISGDLRAKAWLVYFTRPLSRSEYILGKAAILGVIVALVTMVPALVLWIMGVLVSPSVWVAVTTWDLPLRIILASIVLAVPTVLMALAFSSLTAESRIAAFAWFATWVACWITHSALVSADMLAAAGRTEMRSFEPLPDPFADDQVVPTPQDRPPPPRFERRGDVSQRFRWLTRAAGLDTTIDRWSWLSLYHSLGVLQAWVFGIERRTAAIVPPLITLAVVTLLSLAVLYLRVDRPTRA